MVSRLYKIKGNNVIFIVYANFSMIARLPSGKATRNKETKCAKYIYILYYKILYNYYIIYYYIFYLYIIFIIIVYFVYFNP